MPFIISSAAFATLLKIMGIMVGAWVAAWVLKHIIKFALQRLEGTQRLAQFRQRTETVRSLLNSIISVAFLLLALAFILMELGINIVPLLAGAGVAGVALGFGAQTLVKDFLNGLFLVLEDQFDKGDKVEILDMVGTVRKVGLRTLMLEDAEGNLHYIANGQITHVKRFKKPTAG